MHSPPRTSLGEWLDGLYGTVWVLWEEGNNMAKTSSFFPEEMGIVDRRGRARRNKETSCSLGGWLLLLAGHMAWLSMAI